MRIDLRDGMWADLRERINHAADKRIKLARRQASLDDAAAFDWPTVVVREFVRDWTVVDPDGAPIPLEDRDAIERAPDDVIETLFDPAVAAWTGATTPNQDYAKLIGRLVLGHRVSESEIDRLPDPETFKDALLLATSGTWSPSDLDEADALLLALVRKIKNAKVQKST